MEKRKDLYKILELPKESTVDEIKKKYKKLAFKHHPDRGGDANKFREITNAYEILSDEEKKEKYDKSQNSPDILNKMFGEMPDLGMAGMFMGDPSNLFMNGPDIFMNKPNHLKEKIVYVDITLDDIYLGCKKKVEVDILSKCKKCVGKGYFDDGKIICTKCNGNKIINISQEIAPRVIQQMSIQCDNCKGNGYQIKEDKKCIKCKGDGFRKKKTDYDLNIKKGCYNDKEIILKNKGDYIKELDLNSDLIFKLKLLKHKSFIIDKINLHKEVDIPLGKALCGGYFIIDYLNNEKIYIDINKIINQNNLMKISGKGLPRQEENLIYGDLIIKFNVIFPDSLDKDKLELLKDIFDIKDIDLDENIEISNIEYYNETSNIDEEEEVRENIQCAQQ